MNKILITGATGFVGSALAANLLAEDTRVVALSRTDPGGQRTRAAVEKAATGFGLTLSPMQWSRLSIVEVDFRALDQTLQPHVFEGVTAVWNVAAEMTYSLKKVIEAVDQNVIASSMLYKLASQHAHDCRRFYHVSTAYTVGFGNNEAREEINFTPKLINSYQLSKWMAEVALIQSQKERGLPLAIFRPSVVIGHEQTGWSSGASFGMFLLAAAVLYGKQARTAHLKLDLDADTKPNLVCIDTVVRRAMALMKSESPERQPAEIFNCIGDECVTMTDVVEQLQTMIGVQVSFGAPVNETDAQINAVFERNKQFANGRWTFNSERLQQVLGEEYGPVTMTQDIIGRSVLHYVAHKVAEAKAEERSNAAA
ncbi:SDR family oxidoreductase [Stigmatella sp. ncwal1]|uniref:SDR family oxidoreductase n=1 Tax=Stigmatella ashevillensis TaxID=2995309 RepID=A0ABT5DMW8_9BACT|nr:SDR family oxidoreductase [Stigmatella ashevillena]MDC0714891.1 SDR family oxidoreductase [Stigmatella ashevillena]